MNADLDQQLTDCLNDTFGLDLANAEAARAWLFSAEGQQRLAEWAAESDGWIEVPAIALRPLDQVFGDRDGVLRESLTPKRAAEVNEALAGIEAAMDDGQSETTS